MVQVFDLFRDIPVIKILGGEVDGDRQQRQVGGSPVPELEEDLLDHIQIQFVQQVVILQHGNEVPGGNGAADRIVPAGQRLKRGGFLRRCTADALVEHPDPFFAERAVQILDDIALVPVLRIVQAGIDHICAGQIPAEALKGALRMVHRFREHHFGAEIDNAGLDAGGVPGSIGTDLPVYAHQAVGKILFAFKGGDQDDMIVGAAGNEGIREVLFQGFRDEAQELVAFGETVLVVVELHGIQIGIDQHRRFPVQTERADPVIGKFLHIVDVGKAGDGVPVEEILLEEVVILVRFLHVLPGGVDILPGDEGQLFPVRHGLPVSDGVDGMVSVGMAAAEKDIVSEFAARETFDRTRHAPGVVRMENVILAGFQELQQFLPGRFHLGAQAVGDEQGNDLPVLHIKDGERQET